MDNFKLDFIGIGGQRCGTTWVSECLRDHPEICFSKDKETHFFTLRNHLGFDWLKSNFSHCESGGIKGEFTTDYFEDIGTADKIIETFPEAKIIACVRNPVKRTFSHYLYRKRKAGYPKRLSQVIEKDHKKIIENSLYGKYFVPFLKKFPKENVLVLVHDESFEDPLAYIQKIYKFLGVDDSFVPKSLYEDINRSKNQNHWFPPLEWLAAYRMTFTSSSFGKTFTPLLKSLKIHKFLNVLRGLNRRSGSHKEQEFISSDDEEQLNKIFEKDIKVFESYLGRRINIWH